MAELADLEATLKAKREASKARREAEAERLKSAALQQQIDEEDWDTAAAATCEEHGAKLGVQGVDWQVARLRDAVAILKRPPRGAWEKYADARTATLSGAPCDAIHEYVRACLVHPSKRELSEILDRLPSFLATCGSVAMVLGQGGARDWEGK